MSWTILAVLLVGCGQVSDRPDGLELLEPTDHLVRASMAVRGTRPTEAEFAQVEANPEALGTMVDIWLQSPEFGATIRDMWAEVLLLRNDTFNQLPALGELDGYVLDDMYQGTVEEPLRYIEHLVMADRPFTDLVTGQDMMAGEVTAKIYGVPYDFDRGGWQLSSWPDARPRAGILSSAQVWRRWESDGSNFNRARANMVAARLLCEDFETRDILVDGGIDIADEFAVAHAVQSREDCVSCHQSLDPLAAYFWGYKRLIHRNYVADSITGGCRFNWADGRRPEFGPSYLPEDYCYPIKQYNPADEDDWYDWELREPSYYGVRAHDLAEVGELIAADPRFSQCMARQFFGYLTQLEPEEVPFELAVELQGRFEASGFSARQLVRDIVLHPQFAAIRANDPEHPVAGLRTIRPEQFSRTVEELTGFRWMARADPPNCNNPSRADVQRFGTQCWGVVELTTTDVYGFRSMQGGVDGKVILDPTHTVTPTKALTMAQLAGNAAAYVVDTDLALPRAQRRLLRLVEAGTTDKGAVKAQIAALHLRILGQRHEPGGADVRATYKLFELGRETRGSAAGGWALVIATLLQDPRMMFW